MRASLLLSLVVFPALLLVGTSLGFAQQSGSSEERAIEVFGAAEWRIESIAIDGVAVALSDSVVTNLMLASDMSALSGTVGCNNTTAFFELGDVAGVIVFSPIISTRMACPEPAMTQEHAAIKAISEATNYRQESGRLVLSGPSSELVLAPAAPPIGGMGAPMGNEFLAFNAAVAKAAESGAAWTGEALRVALAYIELLGGADITVTLASADVGSQAPAEAASSVVVTVAERGLLDDSLAGAGQRVSLMRSDAYWVVTGHETTWQCRRGPESQVVEPLRCP